MDKLRIGFGYDIHALEKGRRLVLGGIDIPFAKGPKGHSDADVLIHALCDAILGALGQGDIGQHFPDTDPAYKDIASRKLLERVYDLMSKMGFSIGNLDTMLLLEEPKISPFKEEMKNLIARVLHTSKDNINIKAGTNEGLGPIGASQAIASYCVVIIIKR